MSCRDTENGGVAGSNHRPFKLVAFSYYRTALFLPILWASRPQFSMVAGCITATQLWAKVVNQVEGPEAVYHFEINGVLGSLLFASLLRVD